MASGKLDDEAPCEEKLEGPDEEKLGDERPDEVKLDDGGPDEGPDEEKLGVVSPLVLGKLENGELLSGVKP